MPSPDGGARAPKPHHLAPRTSLSSNGLASDYTGVVMTVEQLVILAGVSLVAVVVLAMRRGAKRPGRPGTRPRTSPPSASRKRSHRRRR